jgi:hypothetical protein
VFLVVPSRFAGARGLVSSRHLRAPSGLGWHGVWWVQLSAREEGVSLVRRGVFSQCLGCGLSHFGASRRR